MRFAGNFHPEWGYLAPAPSLMRTARIVVVATAIGATAGAGVVLTLVERPVPTAVVDAGKTLVVVRSLVQPAEAAAPPAATAPSSLATAAPPMLAAPQPTVTASAPASVQPIVTAPPSVQASAQPIVPPNPPPSRAPLPVPAASVNAKIAAPTASDSGPTSTTQAPTSVAALAESPPATEAAPPPAAEAMTFAPDPAPAPANAVIRPSVPAHNAQQPNAAAVKKKVTSNNDGAIGPILRHLFGAHAVTSWYQN